MISHTTIDQVKDISTYDVVSRYLDLKKSGNNSWTAKSPFSNEKSASFFVVPAKNIFKCFSSGKGGDGITFVMEHEKLTYPQAIEAICGKFGIKVEYESNGQPKEHYDELERLYNTNRATASKYTEALWSLKQDHPAFQDLIKKRKFTEETIRQWQIGYAPGDVAGGYAPSKWNFLSQMMIKAGYFQSGIDVGLLKQKGEVVYDAFRHRVIFPVIDHRGRYVAFGGRALMPDQYNAKYINSDESKIFHKSKTLFGLHFAAHSIRKLGYACLMEGYTDVISFHQAGATNSIATCGTSLTEEQVKLLKNYTNRVILFNDPDEAGQRSTERSINLLIKEGFQTSVVPLPTVLVMKVKPTKKVKKPKPVRETGFIELRTESAIRMKQAGKVKEYAMDAIETIEKIDPDELVRMF